MFVVCSKPTVWDGDLTLGSLPCPMFKGLGSKPTVWDGDLTLGSLPCPMFKGLGSKPTVWDGDRLISFITLRMPQAWF